MKLLFISFFGLLALNTVSSKDSWSGKWFPFNPEETTTSMQISQEANFKEGDWKSRWFPKEPNLKCDDELESAEADFNDNDIVTSYQFLCLDKKQKYEPNINLNPVQKEHIIPPAYYPSEICTNETITYGVSPLPTYGSYRPNPPSYGLYRFLPIQRWMHTLKLGGIVGLYHPCANEMQIELFKSTIQSCLYGHVITPSNILTADRPLAVLSYGRSLELSVFEPRFIRDFIRSKNRTLEVIEQNAQWYTQGLLKEAKLVTTLNDEKLCPYNE